MTCRKKITFSLVLLTLALILAVVFIPPTGSSLDEVEIADSTQVQQIVYQYGIPVDDYQVDYGIVQRGFRCTQDPGRPSLCTFRHAGQRGYPRIFRL